LITSQRGKRKTKS